MKSRHYAPLYTEGHKTGSRAGCISCPEHTEFDQQHSTQPLIWYTRQTQSRLATLDFGHTPLVHVLESVTSYKHKTRPVISCVVACVDLHLHHCLLLHEQCCRCALCQDESQV